jgi:hypothetical protein
VDAGVAGIVGAAVGGAMSLLTTVGVTLLRHHLRTSQAKALDKIRKERLTQMLSLQKFTWRSIENLSSAIGADEEKTAALLLQIGARKSMANRDNWALVSRSPFPDERQPNAGEEAN